VQEELGIRVAREPLAVSIFVDNFRNAVGSDHDWFWYMWHEQGFEWGGRKVHSVFVIPLALVKDVRSVTVDELAEDQIAMLALARHRLYTYEGEDIDLYAMDEEQRKDGFRPVSFRKGDPVYLPERLSLVPLLLGTSASEAR
jgi:hypothetical protein